jgi:hypothetical protein
VVDVASAGEAGTVDGCLAAASRALDHTSTSTSSTSPAARSPTATSTCSAASAFPFVSIWMQIHLGSVFTSVLSNKLIEVLDDY